MNERRKPSSSFHRFFPEGMTAVAQRHRGRFVLHPNFTH